VHVQSKLQQAVEALLSRGGVAGTGHTAAQYIDTVVRHLKHNVDLSLIVQLGKISDDAKVLIIQQFFRHTHVGSHKTEFDSRVVPALLREWFGIELDELETPTLANGNSEILPGRPASGSICHLKFGETDIFLHSPETRTSAVDRLVSTVEHDAALTTDKTSPPCEITEFVPLWLRERGEPSESHYLRGGAEYSIEDYFQSQLEAIFKDLGIEIREPSTEMALIANGDALRFHRDRLVNQYTRLQDMAAPPEAHRLVQDLTLADWDMQNATISGTLFDHPNGDRYLFPLFPGEIVSLFFSEAVSPPGPMMMPYHCALPVFDRFADVTVGPAKGKRISTLIRGFASAEELRQLGDRAVELFINDVVGGSGDRQCYANGLERRYIEELPATSLMPVRLLENSQGLSIAELDAGRNHQLLRALNVTKVSDAAVFHIEKHGDGFSGLHELIPEFHQANLVYLINRSRHSPHLKTCYPIALDFTHQRLPWIQLCRMRDGDILSCPRPERGLLRLSPPDEILHRSALLDSFYPAANTKVRMVNAVDVVIVS
jgi:hypothetical protein